MEKYHTRPDPDTNPPRYRPISQEYTLIKKSNLNELLAYVKLIKEGRENAAKFVRQIEEISMDEIIQKLENIMGV